MSLLGAVALDFAEQLMKRTGGWTISPLVVCEERIGKDRCGHEGLDHNSFLFVRPVPPQHSPIEFYRSHPPTGSITFLRIKQAKRPLRLIGLRVEAGVNCHVHLSFWRANGYVQHDAPQKRRFARYSSFRGGVEGHAAMLMCRMYHVGPKASKGPRQEFRHHFDLTSPEPPDQLLDLTVRIIDKSYVWHGRGHKELFGHYQFPLMIDLQGKNYNADRHHV